MRSASAISGLFALLITASTVPATTAAAAAVNLPADRPLVDDRCPVTTDEFATPSHEVRWNGYSVRFCCERCQRRFAGDPALFVTRLPQLPPEVVDTTILADRGDVRQGRFFDLIDFWSSPVLLGLAGCITLWLVARVVRAARHPVGRSPPAATS